MMPAATGRAGDALVLRPVTEADCELIDRLRASTRAEELADLPLGVAHKEHFLRSQLDLQERLGKPRDEHGARIRRLP